MGQDESGIERRKDPRAKSMIPVEIYWKDINIVTETINVSRSGVYCEVNKSIEPGSRVKVCLSIPFNRKIKKMSCAGVVVRIASAPAEGFFNIAIHFDDIEGNDALLLAEYVRHDFKK